MAKYITRRKNITPTKIIKKAEGKARGAPTKSEDVKIEDNGLTKEQNRRLKSLHLQRNVPVKFIIREAIDWYLDALDMGKRLPIINQELETTEEAQEKIIDNYDKL
jgi:hypothetical protein